MLNGIAPILIFNFPVDIKGPTFNALAGIPFIGESLAGVGVPIPLYLDEQLTGLFVDNESKSTDLEIEVTAKATNEPPDVKQQAIDSVVNINLFAKKDSLLLSVILALNDIVFTRAASMSYSVSYLNGSTVIFGGLIKSLTTNSGIDDDLIRMTLTISKANYRSPTQTQSIAEVPKTTGPIPEMLPSAT
jgi:hypothetical protein